MPRETGGSDRSYRRLHAWHACHALTLAVYSLTRRWPGEERYGLTSQVRRASVSAEANIAEGAAKRGAREFARYLGIANGSLSEVECLFEIARDLHYMNEVEWQTIEGARRVAAQRTSRLLTAIRGQSESTPGLRPS